VVGGELAPMKEFYLLALEDTAQEAKVKIEG
jgi:hypothetical protein